MFRVEWMDAALAQLAAIWTDADSITRAAITIAVNQIERLLGSNPRTQGESREDNRRTFFVGPLGVDFEEEPSDRKAVVLRVWLVRKRKT